MRVLGLAQGVKNGFCILQDGKILESGVEDLTQIRGKDNEVLLIGFRKWLSQIMRLAAVDPSHTYDLIVFKQAPKSGKEMTEIIEEKVKETGMECISVTSQAVKKATLSKANATKAQMEAWAASKLQRKPTDPLVDDSEVNALALAFYGYQNYNVPQGQEPPK